MAVARRSWHRERMALPARRPAREDRDSPRALVVWAVGVVAAATVLMAALFVVRHMLLLLYVCALLAIGLSPLVRWLERRELPSLGRYRAPRWAVILALYLVVLSTLAGAAAVVVPPLVTQAQQLSARAPELVERSQQMLERHGLARVDIGKLEASLSSPSDVAGSVLGTVSGLFGGVLGLVTILILTFYFLLEADALVRLWLRCFPHERRTQALAIGARVTEKVSGWLLSQLLLAAIVGTSATIALALLGVPFPYVLGILAGLAEFIPFAGPFVVGVLATAIATVAVSWNVGLATAGYYALQQLIESNVLIPKLMGHQVGLSPALVIVAVLLGHALLGVTGALLAVPTAAILQATLHEIGSTTR